MKGCVSNGAEERIYDDEKRCAASVSADILRQLLQ